MLLEGPEGGVGGYGFWRLTLNKVEDWLEVFCRRVWVRRPEQVDRGLRPTLTRRLGAEEKRGEMPSDGVPFPVNYLSTYSSVPQNSNANFLFLAIALPNNFIHGESCFACTIPWIPMSLYNQMVQEIRSWLYTFICSPKAA